MKVSDALDEHAHEQVKTRRKNARQLPPSESREFSENSGVVSTFLPNVRTLKDLLRVMEVDETVWEVKRHVINKWEIVMREPATTVGGAGKNALIAGDENGGKHTLWTRGSNRPMHEPLFQVKAWLERRTPKQVDEVQTLLAGMLKEFRKIAPVRRKIPRVKSSNVLIEIDLFDHHFGKLCWGPETGTDWDLKIADHAYGKALEGLLSRLGGYEVERFLYPLGNDFFHIDNAQNTTTKGTIQDADGRWQKSFIVGRSAIVKSIERLREIAPVDVVMVPGNHDLQRVFYLGEVLHAYFHRTAGVTINNSPATRKYYRWGRCLIGFTHGNEEKHTDLPLIMATEAGADWSDALFREIHCGHFHKRKDLFFIPVEEHRSIRVRSLSSLTAGDAWHVRKGYEGLRAATGFIWNKDEGLLGEFAHNLMGLTGGSPS